MSEISWQYGVTTVPERLKDGLLERTLTSLVGAGFPEPRLFIDGLAYPMSWDSPFSSLPKTCRQPKMRLQGNFHLGLSELFIRDPHADYYAMFQDDFVTYKNLREYLEHCRYPGRGYLNLYTFKQNQKGRRGWYESNQMGKGAVALVFNNEAVKTLLNSSHMINRPAGKPQNPGRTWKFVDGGVVEAFRLAGQKEYVHNPSLVQHTGRKSTLGNPRHPQAPSFMGEDFNAMSLLDLPSVSANGRCRMGLVGYSAGPEGEFNRKLANNLDVYRWLVKPHIKDGFGDHPDNIDVITCPVGEKIPQFLKAVDVVVFVGKPLYPNLLEECKAANKRTMCINPPKHPKPWLKDVDDTFDFTNWENLRPKVTNG